VTADGKPLASGLVSDFDMPEPPATAAKVRTLFEQYLAILDSTGLRPFFEPVQRRVTLSSHAGAFKPDRTVFVKALSRLKSKASLGECLFITENHAHVSAVRATLGMHALEFRSGTASASDFDDWLQAPAMIAHLVDPADQRNAEPALRQFLRTAHGFDLQGTERSTVRGTLWQPVGPAAGKDLADVRAPFSVEGKVARGPAGKIQSVRFENPAPDEVTEAASFVRSLAQHGQARQAAPDPGHGATHEIETDADGRRKLVRKRFRAI
jgi:hypothetical protein